jgi:hypothetical protein
MNQEETNRAQQAKQVLEKVEAAVRQRELDRRVNEAVNKNIRDFNYKLQHAFDRRDIAVRPYLNIMYAAYITMHTGFQAMKQHRLIGESYDKFNRFAHF